MPLVAIVDGVRTVAPFLTDEEWAAIRPRAASIVIPCCSGNGFKRTSKNGIRHFVHKTKNRACNWCSETEEHLRLKQVIATTCKGAGWQVDVERCGPDWRADVVAARGRVQVAFEVQLSPVALEELMARQKRYERDSIRGCWFYGEKLLPHRTQWEAPRLPIQKQLPAFFLMLSGSQAKVELGRRCMPIRDAVRLLLAGKVRFCSEQKIERVQQIDFYYTRCWRCQKETGVYRAGWGKNGCFAVSDSGIYGMPTIGEVDYAARPWIVRRVEEFLATKRKNLRITLPRWEYAASSQRHYNSFRCYWCHALFGPEFVLKVYEGEDTHSRLVETDVIRRQRGTEPCPHWCVSDSGDFCC